MASSATADGGQYLQPLAALLWATFVIAALEALRACRSHPGAPIRLFVETFALSLVGVVQTFAVTCVFFAALSALAAVRRRSLRFEGVRLVLYVVLSAIAVGHAFRRLALYPPFAVYMPARAAYVALFAFVAWTCLREKLAHPAQKGRWSALRRQFLPGLALAGAVGCQVLDRLLYRGQYATLHLSLIQVSHLLLALGLWQILPRILDATTRVRCIGWGGALVAMALSAVLGCSSALDAARPYYLSQSMPGRARALFNPYEASREVPQAPVPDDGDALERFRTLSNLPRLPADFDLARYNVLLLMSDSTRFDQTSLNDPEIGSTPHLSALAHRGAFTFKQAFSPSNATFQAVSAFLGMSYPSMLEIETWSKPWKGRLSESELTAPDLFRRGGHDTFWISHDHGNCFSSFMLGLDTRFDRHSLFYSDVWDKTLDRSIGDAALSTLHARLDSKSPFFGVVFFGSPHAPYLAQRRTRLEHTPLERYRQEIREVDEQVGRILRVLFTSALGPRTIVIYMGDHGEEFEEHGGLYHGGTVYSESIHVPLLVWVPGVSGHTISGPTSTTYVLPWLLLHGSAPVREAVNEHLRHNIGPMMRATNGAVISEMLGHDLIKSTLFYPKVTYIYDFLSDRHEAYRTDADPGEQADLFNVDSALSADARERIAAYRQVRAARRRFILRPDVLDPHDGAF